MNIPADCLYTKDHEWVRLDDGIALVGITEFAQVELGDVVFVQLPPVGTKTNQGDTFGTIEAVKAVADLYAPISGEIVEVNKNLDSAPEEINRQPYGEGWIVKIKPNSFDGEKASLLSPDAYKDLTTA